MNDLMILGVLSSCIVTILLAFTFLSGYLASKRSYIAVWTIAWALMAVGLSFKVINTIILTGFSLEFIIIANSISMIGSFFLLKGVSSYLGKNSTHYYYLLIIAILTLLYVCYLFIPAYVNYLPYIFIAIVNIYIGIKLYKKSTTSYEYIVSLIFMVWGLHSFLTPFITKELYICLWYLLSVFVEIGAGLGLLVIYFHFVKRENLDTEHKLAAMFHSSFQFVFLLDLEGKLLRANKTALGSIDEESVSEVSGNSFWNCPWWSHSEEVQTQVKEAVQNAIKGEFVRFETTIKNNDGETIFVDFSITPFVDENGKFLYLIPEVRDITDIVNLQEDKIRVEKELYQASKMEAIGTLAGGIAHDFNNVLAAILGNAELMKYQMKEGDEFYESVEQIRKAGNRAKDLVKQILTFSRSSDHKMESLHIDTSVRETIKLLKSFIPTSIEIQQKVSSDIKPIHADLTYIHQIVTNLATNAMHAMDEKGRLKISLENLNISGDLATNLGITGDYVHLSVSDTGSGMSEDVKSRIFDPFYTTKAVGKGTGLGLSVIHGIVTEMNGLIDVDTKIGEGSIFHLYFPVKEEKVVEVVEEVLVSISGTEKIMLVDDDPMVADTAHGILSLLGYTVEVFNDSVKALDAFISNPKAFDLVITDQIMPNMTGDELIREILSLRSDIPVVIATGYSNKIDELKAKELGAKKFLMKPFEFNTLSSVVRECLCTI